MLVLRNNMSKNSTPKRLDKNQVICGDSAQELKKLPDGCIDLTVTSPPYDNLRDYEGYSFNFEGLADQLFRVTKDGGVIVWVVNDATINGSESGTSFRQALYFKEIGFSLHDTMIFQKTSTPFHDPKHRRYKSIFHYVFILSKGKPKTFNPIMDVESKHSETKGSATRNPDGSITKPKNVKHYKFQTRGNIWLYHTGFMKSSKDKVAYEHPAIFPEKLAEDHIISWSNEEDLVLDPFVGSGTTCKMAKLLNRNYIGIDISQKYIDLTNKRLSNAKMDRG